MKNYTITVNGTAYEVTVEENTGNPATTTSAPVQTQAPVSAVAPKVAAPAPKADTPRPAAGGSVGGVKVNAPMPGKILAIKGNVGQSVKHGDVIVILEAMKMENEIVAPQDGVIASINVANGDMIEAGVLLATLN